MEQFSTMDKKNFPRGQPSTSKLCPDKLDNNRKKYAQGTRKKDTDRNEKAPSSRGRTGQRNVRSREKVGSQVIHQNWEAGSIHNLGSKRQRDITHQLIYPEYKPQHWQRHQVKNYGRRSKVSDNFSKEQSLQAKCQFVVAVGNDYMDYEKDPDRLVEWDIIEEVWHHFVELPSCPICLYPPVAAKITKCGHIFCFSCILHYLALSDNKWRKCPICAELVQKDDLKSMIAIQCKEYNIGEEIEMNLMQRSRDSLVPSAVHSTEMTAIYPYRTLAHGFSNLKLIIAGIDEVIKLVLDREQKELDFQKETEGDQPESCFIHEALILLEDRRQILMDNSSLLAKRLENLNIRNGAVSLKPVYQDHIYPESQNGPKQMYYFYQAKCGSNIYLNSLNVQMLTTEFKSFANCPPTIRGSIVKKESMPMTSYYRQRFSYLKHIPLSCTFDIMELSITEPIFSQKTISIFKNQIELHARDREQKEKEEMRIERRVRMEEDKMFGRSKKWVDIHLDSRSQFPDFSKEPSIVSENYVEKEAAASEQSNSTPKWKSQSFAQMAKNTQKVVVPEPLLQWPSLPGSGARSISEDDEDSSYSVPAYKATFFKATQTYKPTGTPLRKEKGKNSKKKRKTVNLLFSTGGQKI